MYLRKKLTGICILLFALSLLASCSKTGSVEIVSDNESSLKNNVSESPQELRIAGNEIACGVDPTVYPAADYLINMGAAELLFKVDVDGIIKPSLAKSAKQIDAHTWEIELRPEATFWSGTPVTAKAVIASLMRSKEMDMKANPSLQGMDFIPSGEFTIKVITEASNLDIVENLSYSQLVIHNTEEQYTYTDIYTADYTGMYKVVGFEPSQRMIFEKNENYWGVKPEIQRVVHEQIGDSDARVIAAMSGEYHVVLDIDRTACAQIDDSDVSHIVMVPGAQTMTVYLNAEKAGLDDFRVRQALGWGLDRNEVILLGMEGLSEPVTTWLGANPAYSDIKNAFFDVYDPEKAAELLDEAGWILSDDGYRYKDGVPLAMLVRTFRNDKALGEAIQMQWRKLGVKVSVQHGDYSLMSTAYKTGEWGGAVEGWGTYGNIVGLLNAQYGPNGSANYGHFKDEKLDGYLTQLAKAPDFESRQSVAKRISLYIAEQSPAIYICSRPQITAVNNDLEGFIPHFRQFENVVNANLRIRR